MISTLNYFAKLSCHKIRNWNSLERLIDCNDDGDENTKY